MATYNGRRFIAEQIESILSQPELGDELVIGDDQSSDDTITYLLLDLAQRVRSQRGPQRAQA